MQTTGAEYMVEIIRTSENDNKMPREDLEKLESVRKADAQVKTMSDFTSPITPA